VAALSRHSSGSGLLLTIFKHFLMPCLNKEIQKSNNLPFSMEIWILAPQFK
jgi:hypothetical protein